jgi:hypothetical protein
MEKEIFNMEPCEFMATCPILGRFKDDRIDEFWVLSYCYRDAGSACRRKQLRITGKAPDAVPRDLLPNGEYLSTYEHTDRTLERLKEDDCPYISSCMEFFNEFKEESNRSVWTTRHCFRNNGADCVRKQKYEQQVAIPRNLLPNGEMMT